LSDNGDGETALFQPMSREQSYLSDKMKLSFLQGLQLEIGQLGWRKLWLAFDKEKIVGHLDIRSHPMKYTGHRALLGMGVDRLIRKTGLGGRLLTSMLSWVEKNTEIEFIDLCVLSSNLAAQRLYLRNGFEKSGEIEDMFRINGQSLSHTMMSRKVIQAVQNRAC